MTDDQRTKLVTLTGEITAAYVGAHTIGTTDLPGLMKAIHHALTTASSGTETKPVEEAKVPAVPIRRSVTPDHIVCLEDGKKFKSLKRHLRTKYDLTPDDYRAKWGLPSDYPMVCPNYAAQRSALALSMGLGKGGRKAATTKPTTAVQRAPKARAKKAT